MLLIVQHGKARPDHHGAVRCSVVFFVRPSCVRWCWFATRQGKIARDDVAQLVVALLDAPAAVDTTFEIKSTVPFSEPYKAQPDAPPRDWQARDCVGSRVQRTGLAEID